MNIVEKPGASVALEAGGAGGAISISPFSPGVPVVGFKGMSVDSAVTRQLLLPRKNAFTPRLEGRDWPDSLRRPGSVQSAPPPPRTQPPEASPLQGRRTGACCMDGPRGLGVHRRSHWTVQDPRDSDEHLYGVAVKHMGRG